MGWARPGAARIGRHGEAWQGRRGAVWQGPEGRGWAGLGRLGTAGHGMARRGEARINQDSPGLFLLTYHLNGIKIVTMVRFTLIIDDDLNTWLKEQSRQSHRSKNKHIEYLLERAKKDSHTPRYRLGTSQLCANGTHLFSSNNPAMGEFCNCQMYIFGEICNG
jgi:hypothetical protein